MAKHNKISVILTSYNHANFLRESIDSVLNQTFSDFDFIIWDDGSVDDSWQIINSYSDPRIRAFRNVDNLNGNPIRTVLSEIETGEYIAIHHSDDVWEPQKLEKQMAFLEANLQIGAVFSNAYIIDENSRLFTDVSHYYYKIFDQPNRNRHEWLNYFFYHGNVLCHPSVLIRKTCYTDCGPYRYGFSQLADFDMWVRMCLKYEIYVLQEKLVRFRVQSGESNTSGGRPEVYIRSQFEFLQVYSNYLSLTDREEFLQVFPDSSPYFEKEEFDIPFALAMTSFSSPYMFAKLFGLQLLFGMISYPEYAKKIEKLYGFRNYDLFKLTGRYDVFSVELIPNLRIQIAEKELEIQILNTQVDGLTAHVDGLGAHITEISNSRTWKIGLFLHKVGVLLLSPFTMIRNIYRNRKGV